MPLRAPFDSESTFDVLICEDMVGIMSTDCIGNGSDDGSDDGSNVVDIVVYNWKIASLMFQLRGCIHPVDTFTFLSPQHILLGISDPDCPRLEVYDLSQRTSRDPEWNGYDYLCAFLYENEKNPNFRGRMKVQGDTPPWSTPLNDREVPFFTPPESRFLCVSYLGCGEDETDFTAVLSYAIPLQALLSLLPQSADETGTTWLWDVWSFDKTLMHPQIRPGPHWRSYIHGAKIAYLSTPPEREEASLANVMDFSPVVQRRDCARRGKGGPIRLSTGRRGLSVNYGCLTSQLIFPEMYKGMIISEDNLILIDQDPESEDIIFTIYSI
ncbi:hypothetical protein OE88DRAFT_1740407 [Heliocybe sulcata]|uniref:WD40 repeat-like protein n=1 Tax=Heliocybe sulcata TaxID=5364 RepID=A0A5C3MK89_9AGAM|nr:hypothetical protein OE88DRAFT_1740407 [Heliocybe sulcata]